MIALYSWKYRQGTFSLSNSRIWTASVHYALRAGMRPVLVADEVGVRYLADGLKLPFAEVLPLPAIPDELVHVYDLTKLTALQIIAERGEPVIHVDHDAFIRRPLPKRILEAPYAAEFRYRPSQDAASLHGSLPVPRFAGDLPTGLMAGIMGGNATERIVAVCRESLRVALDQRNRRMLVQEPNGFLLSTIFGELAFGEAFPDAEELLPRGPSVQEDYYKVGYMHAAGLKKDAGTRCEMLEFFKADMPEVFAATLPAFDSYHTGR
jgi:hypothetical protein